MGTRFLHIACKNGGSWNNCSRGGQTLKAIYQGEGQGSIPVFCKYDRMARAAELKAHPDNAHRSHPEKQLDRYEAVISGNGWRKAVVVSKRSGFIVKGHGAWLTAARRGWKIPIELQPYASLAEERRDLIADNRLAQDAVTDDQKLDPGYVAVSIQRWADATGGKPKLVG